MKPKRRSSRVLIDLKLVELVRIFGRGIGKGDDIAIRILRSLSFRATFKDMTQREKLGSCYTHYEQPSLLEYLASNTSNTSYLIAFTLMKSKTRHKTLKFSNITKH